MTETTRGVIAGIGGGTKSHLTTIYTEGEKTYIRESGCGSVKVSGWSKSRTYGAGIEGPAFDLVQTPEWPEVGSEGYEANVEAYANSFRTNLRIHENAERALAPEFLKQANACSKCAKHAEWLLANQAA